MNKNRPIQRRLATIAAALGLASAGAVVPGFLAAPAHATVPGSDGLIAYVSNRVDASTDESPNWQPV